MSMRVALDRWNLAVNVYHYGPIRPPWLTHVTVVPVGWVPEVHVYMQWGLVDHGGGLNLFQC